MLNERWTYSSQRPLTKWYGNVDYYDPYVIGQWFALNAETGEELWSRKIFRANDVCGCEHDVIVASETRSDGPWTANYGIYGIDATSGELLWTSHARGVLGKLIRCLDYVPLFTNDLRDAPKKVVDRYVITERNRFLDIRTGRDVPRVDIRATSEKGGDADAQRLYDNNSLKVEGGTIKVEGHRADFAIYRTDGRGGEVWRFAAKEGGFYVEGDFYTYRLHNGRIYIVLGDGPSYVPVNPDKPMIVKPSPANYQLGVLDIETGECTLCPLAHAEQRTACRIETLRGSRLLISCDNKILTEYTLAP